ncbi:3-hydroxybutyryl-CoA dehydrogenase [Salinimicrobium marinum]|uniref:3-hydroxybutyryl-CoA dehydrogenase n=1 Tax=Salinimicrobium marinum TaxID=680283 RepID=A0A918VX74_9FLAO|nr:3-hydroxyacyl-CoA dehydrogenase [Salinimicrobium marinum]GHA30857.1 3-hydroxybutyryl-CoA dehydrogenase [Salinimicrobium marinum]
MQIKNVTVYGSGVLGAQIAYQAAYHNFSVIIYDLNEELLEKARKKFSGIGGRFIEDLNAPKDAVKAAYGRISYSTDVEEAVKDADLAIEAIPENVEIKKEFYTKLGKLAPEKTIFATNSSTLLPSQFANETGRPERFLALHFANEIWKQNTAEVMGHPGTDPQIFETVAQFAKDIGMVVIPVKKEQPGYVLNSLLVPLLNAGLFLYANEVADFQTVDKTWMVATGAPKGPFAIFDIVGLNTAYNITKANPDPKAQKAAVMLKERFIDKGKLGVATGEGFYNYPNPEYEKEDFLK